MSQAEDLLNSLTVDNEDEEHIIIDKDRVISVPQSLRRIAVQHDNNVRTVTFDCPRYSDGRDLSQMIISINYMRSDGAPGLYLADNIVVDETDDTLLHFDWTIKDYVTEVSGALSFLVCAKKANSEGIIENHWNSELNQEMTISKGLECIEQIIEKYPDVIAQILTRLQTVENKESFNANGAESNQVPTADGNGNWSWKGIEFPETVTDDHIRELITGYNYSTFSGSYNDLSDKPEIPEQVTDDHIRELITGYNYSTFSGSYNDLSDKPEIPEQVTDDHIRELITGYNYSTFSGSYNDLSDKPDIPEVTRETIKNALGYVPPEYDENLFDKYVGSFINIPNTSEGTALLIKTQNDLDGHTVTSCGKNLFDINGELNINLSTGEDRPGYVMVENGVLTANLHTSGYHPNGQCLYGLKGKTVTFSALCISEDVNGYIGIYEDGNEDDYVTGKGLLKIEKYVCKSDNPIFGFNTAGTDTGAKFTNIQIEIGDTATDYESYVSDTMMITSDSNEYSIKTYADQTNIFNDGSLSMTVMISSVLNRLQYENSLSVKRRDIIVSDANVHTSTGYAKTEYGVTQNLPDQVRGTSSENGVLFFIAENSDEGIGTQLFYPTDGPYKGRVFSRSLMHMAADSKEVGTWTLLATEAEVNAAKGYANAYTDQNALALLNYIHSIIKPYDLTWIDGYYVSKDDGSMKAEVGSSCTDFVSVEPGDKLIISNTMTVDIEYNVFYDLEKNFVSSFSTNDGNVVTVPDGAKYFRLSKHNQDTVVIVPEIVPSVTDDHINNLIDTKLGVVENGAY